MTAAPSDPASSSAADPTTQLGHKGMATRQSILTAGEQIFADLGYAAARLEDVAVQVGIRRASLIYYFRGKQELYDQIEADIFAALQAATVSRLTAAATPWDRLMAILDSWLDFMVARPTAARFILRMTADGLPQGDNPTRFSEITLATLESIYAEGLAAGTFRQTNPMHLVSILGGGILNYVCLATLFGDARVYRPADPEQLEQFRATLRTMAHALLVQP